MRVKFRVNLAKPVKGQAIADAVRVIAGRDYHQVLSIVSDDGSVYQIGQNSSVPYEDLVVGVGAEATPEVAMEVEYTEVYVLSWEHRGAKYAIGFSDDNVVEAMRSFRDKLESVL